MQDLQTGMMRKLSESDFGHLKKIFDAGKLVAPLFAVGEELDIKNGRFKILAIDERLMVLEGIPSK